jgi:hypothetical protein
MDIPIPALLLAAVGAVYLTLVVFSGITLLAEIFVFKGMKVGISLRANSSRKFTLRCLMPNVTQLKNFGAKKGKWAGKSYLVM